MKLFWIRYQGDGCYGEVMLVAAEDAGQAVELAEKAKCLFDADISREIREVGTTDAPAGLIASQVWD